MWPLHCDWCKSEKSSKRPPIATLEIISFFELPNQDLNYKVHRKEARGFRWMPWLLEESSQDSTSMLDLAILCLLPPTCSSVMTT